MSGILLNDFKATNWYSAADILKYKNQLRRPWVRVNERILNQSINQGDWFWYLFFPITPIFYYTWFIQTAPVITFFLPWLVEQRFRGCDDNVVLSRLKYMQKESILWNYANSTRKGWDTWSTLFDTESSVIKNCSDNDTAEEFKWWKRNWRTWKLLSSNPRNLLAV